LKMAKNWAQFESGMGFVPHSNSNCVQIAAISTSTGRGEFARLRRYKRLKIREISGALVPFSQTNSRPPNAPVI